MPATINWRPLVLWLAKSDKTAGANAISGTPKRRGRRRRPLSLEFLERRLQMCNPFDCPEHFRSSAQTIDPPQWWDDKTGNGLTTDDTLHPGYSWQLTFKEFDPRTREIGAVTGTTFMANGAPAASYGACWTYYPDGLDVLHSRVLWGCSPTIGTSIRIPVGRWISTDSDLGDNDSVYFNQPSIGGLVFEDRNGNGVQDANELGAPFVRVQLDGDERLCPSTYCGHSDDFDYTDEAGQFLITDVGPRADFAFPLWVQTTTEYLQTTPAPQILPRSGESIAGQKLGIFRYASVSGRVFNDLDGDGVFDPEESARRGTPVFLDTNGDRIRNAGEPSTASDAEGNYSLSGLGPGVVYAAPGSPASLFSITTLSGTPHATESGAEITSADLGVFQNVTVYGQVFRDSNGDGLRDHYADSFLPGETIQLDLNGDGTVDRTATTNANGYFEFRSVGPGQHRIRPILGDDRELTAPEDAAGHLFRTVSGQSIGPLLFGIAEIAPLIVNSNAAGDDLLPGDEKCDTGVRLNGVAECTLWAAIQEANAQAGRQRIQFDAAINTIDVAQSLPEITGPVKIVGGAAKVALLGNAAGGGLKISGGNSIISGLVVAGFDGIGIELLTNGDNVIENCTVIGGGAEAIVIREDSNRNKIRNNLLGTDSDGADRGNESAGVRVGSNSNVIGGDTPADGNIIAFNARGVAIDQGFNRVEHNVIVANREEGVHLVDGNNVVRSNHIGALRDGTKKGNAKAGIRIDSEHNTIGGTTVSAGNVIANNLRGVDVTLADDNTIDNNEILGNQEQGLVFRDGSDKNFAYRNYIGVDRSGRRAGNGSAGIWIASSNNSIGKNGDAAFGNVVAYNGGDESLPGNNSTSGAGVVVAPFPDSTAATTPFSGNSILANSIYWSNGPGIDLSHDGGTPNDSGSQQNPIVLPDQDAGPNGLQNAPEIAVDPSGLNIVGQFFSTPNSDFVVEFFASPLGDLLIRNEGKAYLGATTIRTDAAGVATFQAAFAWPDDHAVAATATRIAADGAFADTSEFSDFARKFTDSCSDVELQELKDEKWKGILRNIDLITQDNYGAWSKLRQLALQTVRPMENGCIPVSLQVLDNFAEVVDTHAELQRQNGWWEEFSEILGDDFQRIDGLLKNGYEAILSELLFLYDNPEYRSQRALAFDDAMRDLIRSLRSETYALSVDFARDWDDILFDSAVLLGKDLRNVEFYADAVQTLTGYKLFLQAFNSEAPVEQRVGYFLAGMVTYLESFEGGLSTGKGLVETTRLKALANRFAREVTDDPLIADTMAVVMRKRLDAIARGEKVVVSQLLDGEEISIEMMDQLGWTPAQIQALREIAMEKGVAMQFRTTNVKSARFIQNGTATPKPVDVKAKTINPEDVYLGYRSEDQGLVGLKNPDSLNQPHTTAPCVQNIEPLCSDLMARYLKHVNDWTKLNSELDPEKYFIDDFGRIISREKNLPVTGDIDPVAFLDADGNNLSGPAYDELVQQLRDSRALVQHGAETNIVDDVIRAMQKACDDGSPKCVPRGSEDWHRKVGEAERLKRDVLEPSHRTKEITFEVGPDGKIRRRVITELPDVASGEGEDPQFSSVPKEQMIRLFSELNIDLRRDRLVTFDSIFAAMNDRADVKFASLRTKVSAAVPDAGIDESAFQSASSADLVELIEAEPTGLHINPITFTDAINRGEGEDPITAQDIVTKIRAAVGDANLTNFRVDAKTGGGFVVYSRSAQHKLFDVDGDSSTAPIDALIIINALNSGGTAQLNLWPTAAELRTDKNADGYRSPIDALMIINFINNVTGFASGEGEHAASPDHVFPNMNELLEDDFSTSPEYDDHLLADASPKRARTTSVATVNSLPCVAAPPAKWSNAVSAVFAKGASKTPLLDRTEWWNA